MFTLFYLVTALVAGLVSLAFKGRSIKRFKKVFLIAFVAVAVPVEAFAWFHLIKDLTA